MKRVRQTAKRSVQNRTNKSRLRTALRKFRAILATGDREAALKQFPAAVAVLDKAVQKGVLHKKTASRYKSRLSARLNALGKA